MFNINTALNGGLAVPNAYGLPNFTEFTGLFDHYRIDKVCIEMFFTNNNSSMNSPSVALPLWYSAKDMDDSTPITQTAMQQYQKCKMTQLGSSIPGYGKFKQTIVPLPLIQLYETSVSTGYGNPPKPIWIDANDATVPHYGYKMCIDLTNNNTVLDTVLGQVLFVFTYQISCKSTR